MPTAGQPPPAPAAGSAGLPVSGPDLLVALGVALALAGVGIATRSLVRVP
ncbi:MAG TPA: hypothetical protein VGN69_03410 [Solirubrobacteraceae bacterium]|nr:hypothetical protein [Solirubrobacteraceae bacterium]